MSDRKVMDLNRKKFGRAEKVNYNEDIFCEKNLFSIKYKKNKC